ncbi:MAG: cation:proton antiporter [Thiohalophilus sp.]|jgi:CPA2 family monovalent cation:H+ antiporter-2
MHEALALMPAIILLLAGILSITIARRIGLSPIVGYLIAGLLIGPHALNLIQESKTTHLLAELGVVFLLFDIGLHFSLSTIWDARRDIFGLGPLQIILCGLGFAGIAALFDIEPEYAMILGGALALSSTAVVVPTLAERRQQNCPVGITGTAVLIFQDICAIFLLIFATSLGTAGNADIGNGLSTTIMLAVVKAVAAFLAALLIGRFAIKPLFRFFSQTRNEEVFTAVALLVVLATAAATGHAELSLTLGAFLGGMMLSETPYRHVIQTEAKPFRNLLLGFFFITVGMSLDWQILIAHWSEILIFLVVLIAIKVFLVACAARIFGWSTPGSIQLSFLLAQGSEFVFVIIAMPMVREALGENIVGVVIAGVAISLALTPNLTALGNNLARVLRQRSESSISSKELIPSATTKPVIVFGLNEIGRSVADALEAQGVPYDAIEADHDRFLSASADGYPVAFGDPGDVRLMETLAYAERKAIVVTNPRYEVAANLSQILHERYPNLCHFIAVTSDEEKVQFEKVGLQAVVDRSFPQGMDLAANVLRFLQIDDKKIQDWMQRQQERALQATADGAR